MLYFIDTRMTRIQCTLIFNQHVEGGDSDEMNKRGIVSRRERWLLGYKISEEDVPNSLGGTFHRIQWRKTMARKLTNCHVEKKYFMKFSLRILIAW